MNITAIYKHRLGGGTFSAHFVVPDFPTSGANCDTPEILSVLIDGLNRRLSEVAKGYHDAACGDAGAAPTSHPGTRVLAFYTDKRAKALVERFENPIVL